MLSRINKQMERTLYNLTHNTHLANNYYGSVIVIDSRVYVIIYDLYMRGKGGAFGVSLRVP